MGGILDGMPPRVHIDSAGLDRHLARRRPGAGTGVSKRCEPDCVEILSGISSDGLTLGTPIGFIVRNVDARPGDYDGYARKFRPNHADYTYHRKYGIQDWRGGGRASARETVSWVVAGSIVRQWLGQLGVSIGARFVETNCVERVAAEGDSTGGVVMCRVSGLPVGVGEPVADKLHSRLAAAMMSINAVKAFEYGDGFRSASMRGSESLDLYNPGAFPTEIITAECPQPVCLSNHSGGVQGGISNGMPVEFSVYFKPTPTIARSVDSVDTDGNECTIEPKGRHDACVAIRAVPVVESMAALVIGDLLRMRFE